MQPTQTTPPVQANLSVLDAQKRSTFGGMAEGTLFGALTGAAVFGLIGLATRGNSFTAGLMNGTMIGGIVGAVVGTKRAKSHNRWADSAQQLGQLDQTGQLVPTTLLHVPSVSEYTNSQDPTKAALSQGTKWGAIMGGLGALAGGVTSGPGGASEVHSAEV